jgi:hypothetical protein
LRAVARDGEPVAERGEVPDRRRALDAEGNLRDAPVALDPSEERASASRDAPWPYPPDGAERFFLALLPQFVRVSCGGIGWQTAQLGRQRTAAGPR